MADKPPSRREADGANGTGKKSVTTPARAALLAGDFRLARSLAEAVLNDPATSEDARADARQIREATKVDRGPLIAGFIMLIVLAFLFGWVITHPHTHGG